MLVLEFSHTLEHYKYATYEAIVDIGRYRIGWKIIKGNVVLRPTGNHSTLPHCSPCPETVPFRSYRFTNTIYVPVLLL